MAGNSFSESIILSILFGKYKEKVYVKYKDMIVNSYIGVDLSFTNGSETIVLNDKTTNSKLTISTLKMQLESILMVLRSAQNNPEPDNEKVMKKRKRIDDTNRLINDLRQQKDDLTKNGPLYVIDREYRNPKMDHLSDREYLDYLYDNRLIDNDFKNVKKTNKILFWIWFGFSFLFIISPINWMANNLIDPASSCAVLFLGIFFNPFVFRPFIKSIRNLILFIIVCKQDG